MSCVRNGKSKRSDAVRVMSVDVDVRVRLFPYLPFRPIIPIKASAVMGIYSGTHVRGHRGDSDKKRRRRQKNEDEQENAGTGLWSLRNSKLQPYHSQLLLLSEY